MQSRHALAATLLLLACLIVALVLARRPQHGLLLERFSDASFQSQAGTPTVDRKVHFASGDQYHPVPSWLTDHSSARWTGYIDIPREAEYTIGVLSDDGSSLFVDGRPVVENGGVHGPRNKDATIRLTQGYHPIRIDYVQNAGGATMKLEWHRSGNDAIYEIVPVSMLFPALPKPLGTVDRGLRGAPWILLALALWVTRGRAFPQAVGRRRAYVLAAMIFFGALGARLFQVRSEGETCDEWTYVSAGYVYAQNVFAGVTDADSWSWNREHASVGKLIYGAVQFVFGPDSWKMNATAAFMGALTVLAVYWVGVRLLGLFGGVAAGVVAALIPSLLAHGRIAGLDAPAVLFFVLALSFLLRGMQEEHDRSWSFAAMVICTGLGVGSKLSDLFLLPLIGLGLLLLYWLDLRRLRWPRLPFVLYLAPILIPLIVLGTWPWLWVRPLDHWAMNHRRWEYDPPDVFWGHVGPTPPIYFFAAFVSVVPLGLFPFFFVGAAQLFRRAPALMSRSYWILLSAWFLIPFAWTLTGWRMNGVRYVLNSFPPFALLCGAGLVLTGQWLARRAPYAPPVLLTLVFLYLVVADARIHPYYLDYFNEATGGAGNVQRRQFLDTGWWGEGLNKAVDWVNTNAAPGASCKVEAWSPPGVMEFRADLRRDESQPDYIVRQMQPIEAAHGYEDVYEVRADGARIAGVFRRR